MRATAPPPDTRLAAAHRFRAGIVERAAERVTPLPWGSAVSHSGLPGVADLNAVRVEQPAPGLQADELVAIADELQGGLPQRCIEVADRRTGERLRAPLVRAGWRPDRLLLMEFAGDAAPPASAIAVEEVPYERIESLRAEWIAGSARVAGEAVEQTLAADRLTFTATPARAFTAAGRSYALLVAQGSAAMVEDVYTTPPARGAGLATAVVSRVVAEALSAGHALIFLTTDADGAAQRLYGRLGFRPFGLVHRYVRVP